MLEGTLDIIQVNFLLKMFGPGRKLRPREEMDCSLRDIYPCSALAKSSRYGDWHFPLGFSEPGIKLINARQVVQGRIRTHLEITGGLRTGEKSQPHPRDSPTARTLPSALFWGLEH